MKYWLIMCLIILLTIYAPIELTRIIIRDMFPVYPKGEFVFEIAFLWLCYLSAMITVRRLIWVK